MNATIIDLTPKLGSMRGGGRFALCALPFARFAILGLRLVYLRRTWRPLLALSQSKGVSALAPWNTSSTQNISVSPWNTDSTKIQFFDRSDIPQGEDLFFVGSL